MEKELRHFAGMSKQILNIVPSFFLLLLVDSLFIILLLLFVDV